MADVFIAYSRRDKDWLAQIRTFMEVMQRANPELRFNTFHDQEIKPGEDWPKRIEKELGDASVAVLLISIDFLRSEFIQKVEVPALLKRREWLRLSAHARIYYRLIYPYQIGYSNYKKS